MPPTLVRLLSAVLVGLGIGTAVPPTPVDLPVVGAVPGLLAGATGVLIGAVLYVRGPGLLGTGRADCDCAGDCDCA